MVRTYLPKSHWRIGSRCPDQMFDIFRALILGRTISQTASDTGLSKPTVRKNYDYLLSELFSDFRFFECVKTLFRSLLRREVQESNHYFFDLSIEVFDNIVKNFRITNEVDCILRCPHAPRVQELDAKSESIDAEIIRLLRNTDKCGQCNSRIRPLLSLDLRYDRLSYFKRHRNVHNLPHPERHLRLFLCVIFIKVFQDAHLRSHSSWTRKKREAYTEKEVESMIIVLSEMAKDLITLGKIDYMQLVILYAAAADSEEFIESVTDYQDKRSKKLAAKYSKSRGER